ncbi:Transporter of the ATP-binding cassette (ABC), partial [Coemansia javaensis]
MVLHDAALLCSLAPVAAAVLAWGLLPSAIRPAVHAGLDGHDNRTWIGPLVVVLLGAQALAQARSVPVRAGGEQIWASAVLACGWAAAAAVAGRQLARYMAGGRQKQYGLFGHPVLAFAAASLCASMGQASGALLDGAAQPPLLPPLLLFRLGTSAAVTLLLLSARRLPCPGPAAVSSDAADSAAAAQRQRQRQLSPDGPPCRLAPEIGASILGNLLFCWVGGTVEVARRRQLQPGDLPDMPHKHTQAEAWARFRRNAAPGRSLGWQLARTFRAELLAQLALNPACAVLGYAQPFLMQQLLRTIAAPPDDGLRRGLLLVGAMLVASAVGTVADEQQTWHARLLGSSVRNVLVVLLGRKTLRRQQQQQAGANADGSEGRALNVLTADLSRMALLPNLVASGLLLPARMAIGAWYMYRLLGLAGVLSTLLVAGAVWRTQRLVARARRAEAELGALNDRRLALIGEAVRGIAAVKLFGWGARFVRIIGDARDAQLRTLWARARIWSLINLCTLGSLPLATFAALAAHGVRRGLDAETVFAAIAVFKLVQAAVSAMPTVAAHSVGFYVAFRRIEAFLAQPDVQPLEARAGPGAEPGALGFADATLAWARSAPGAPPPFALSAIDVRFPRGRLTVVGGPTGSGKSSLLAALVGEMALLRGRVLVPTSAGADGAVVVDDIAYVAQEAWLRNATVRDNILLGEPFDAGRYAEVLRMCALGPDLGVLPAGDLTEIGERGVTLSGGQRQRVALARAVYSSQRILLVDDCLAAVDARTGRHILRRCLLSTGAVMVGRTRVLVTHHVAACLPHCDHVVLLDGGRVSFQGRPAEAPSSGPRAEASSLGPRTEASSSGPSAGASSSGPSAEVPSLGPSADAPPSAAEAPADPDAAPAAKPLLPPADGRLVDDEVRIRGLIKPETWGAYFGPCGGGRFVAGCLGCVAAVQLLGMYRDYYLTGRLGRAAAGSGAALRLLAAHLGLGLLAAAASALALLWAYAGGLRASAALHARLLEAIVYAAPRFLEATPAGRIMVRFAKDMQVIDEDVVEILFGCIRSGVLVAIALAALSAAVPPFAAAGLPVLAAYAWLMAAFMQARRETSRLEAASYAPVVSLFGEMLPGAGSIRAFALQGAYMREAEKRLAAHLRADYAGRAQSRWLGTRMALASALASCSTAVFVVLRARELGLGLAAFVLLYAVGLWVESTAAVRSYTFLDLSLGCVERARQYMDVAREAPPALPADAALPPAWPRRGALDVSALVAGYAPGLPVLRALTFSVAHGERIGVVGRTGAGKSTLAQALLRLIEPAAGRIVLDGVDIAGVGLERLRQSVTIVPQDPVLFDGTVRFNLDPFGDRPDALLLDALRRTLLLRDGAAPATGASVPAFDSLDDMVAAGGQNLSLGQRQLVALARALVRRSRLVIMDEATASVDLATDAALQRAIRGPEFADSTLICIAHRLRTVIDYDRILVLDAGAVVEFDSPAALLLKRDATPGPGQPTSAPGPRSHSAAMQHQFLEWLEYQYDRWKERNNAQIE